MGRPRLYATSVERKAAWRRRQGIAVRPHYPSAAAKQAAYRARKQAAQTLAMQECAAIQQALQTRALADQCWERHELIDACSRDPDMPRQVPAGRPPELLAGASAHLYGVAAARSSAWRRSGLSGEPRRAGRAARAERIVHEPSTDGCEAPWHKTSVLSLPFCYPLTSRNSIAALPTCWGSFVSPMRAALYARVSTHDQQTLAMQMDALQEFAIRRGWMVTETIEEIASGAKDNRPKRQALLTAARRRQLDVILVWKLDRWGRSLVDLMMTLRELTALGVGFVSLTEALDLTTPAGRAFAGFLAVFAEFERDLIRERIKAGITDARKRGKAHGRPRATANDAAQIRTLAQQGLSQAAIARQLGVWRTSVRRVLAQQEGP